MSSAITWLLTNLSHESSSRWFNTTTSTAARLREAKTSTSLRSHRWSRASSSARWISMRRSKLSYPPMLSKYLTKNKRVFATSTKTKSSWKVLVIPISQTNTTHFDDKVMSRRHRFTRPSTTIWRVKLIRFSRRKHLWKKSRKVSESSWRKQRKHTNTPCKCNNNRLRGG